MALRVSLRHWPALVSGNRVEPSLPTDRKFTGQRLDESTGLYYYGARYYDPALGRFVQADTIVPEPGNPQALNRYAYVLNNPLRYTDPSGRRPTSGCEYEGCSLRPGLLPDSAWQLPDGTQLPYDPQLAAAYSNSPLLDPQTTAIVQTAVGFLCEWCDWGMTFYAWSQGDFSWWDLAGLLPILPAAVRRNADDLLEVVGDVTRRAPGVRYEYHHTVPLEILNKYLPADVANAPQVRGVRGAPNRWLIPEDVHKRIHQGPGGGKYNERWKEELTAIVEAGRRVTINEVLRIRGQLIREFGLEVYRP